MNHYLHRLYPWQALKLAIKAIRSPPKLSAPSDETNHVAIAYTQQIQTLLSAIHTTRAHEVERRIGFGLQVGLSKIPGAGQGVFLQGTVSPGSVVSFYPGTVYMPSEPLLFVSLRNKYILKCVDGIFVDGKSGGLSGHVHRSLFHRENWPGATQSSDMTWMTDDRKNPLAVGQYINNGVKDRFPSNVRYQEVDLPTKFPRELRQYIPNITWTSTDPFRQPTRVVVLVTTRTVHNEELYSTYMDAV